MTIVVFLFVGVKPNSSSSDNPEQKTLLVESFNATTIGSKVIGGNIVLINPTNKSFENLTLTVKIDDSEPIVPILRLIKPLATGATFNHYLVAITQISIESNQNETIQLYLYNPDKMEPPFYETSVNVQTFSSHVIRFYLTQNTLGDIINGQPFTIPQEKAYLQITGYSSIEHDNDTWHEIFNSTRNRYEYINDKPNFYQQYHHSAFFPLDPSSYNWAKSLNQIGEHYFNVTIFNNNTFPVGKVTLNFGDGGVEMALQDKIIQPNETYVFPIAVSGKDWSSVENVNQLSNFFPAYASGDLVQ
ncbi:MAG: hypothetical protein NWE94_08810 [Candidatus Bathyarchaeota archaeon]|nr:hypothetical protein [Candidatus Bathyarchaeota archaeon]